MKTGRLKKENSISSSSS